MLYVGYGKKKFCMATIRYDSKSNPAYVGQFDKMTYGESM